MAHSSQLQSHLPVAPSNQTPSLGYDTEDYFREQQSDIQQQDSKVEEGNNSMKIPPRDQSEGNEDLSPKTQTLESYTDALRMYHTSKLTEISCPGVGQGQMDRPLNPVVDSRMHPIRHLRLQFAWDYLGWQANDWLSVLFSDIFGVPGFHPECGVDHIQCRSGYMFWISIIDGRKGPTVLLDYSQTVERTFSASDYIQKILPSVEVVQNARGPSTPFFFLHYDPSHRARETVALKNMNIPTMEWPPCSPDLNPITTIRQQLNSYLQMHFSEHRAEAGLPAAIVKAWEAFPVENIYDVVSTMRERCEAVIAAVGGPTRFSGSG